MCKTKFKKTTYKKREKERKNEKKTNRRALLIVEMPENILSCCIIEIFFHMQLMGFSFVRERKATKLIPVKCTDSHHLYTA